MNYVLLSLTGLICGILGGMGMGGGTLLIPALSIFFGVGQHTAQSINLVSFVPLSLAASVVHIKNKLPSVFAAAVTGIFACLFSCLGAILASGVKPLILKRYFGGFLILLSLFQIGGLIFSKRNKNENVSQTSVKINKIEPKRAYKVKRLNKKI